jgi:hypothetical protein
LFFVDLVLDNNNNNNNKENNNEDTNNKDIEDNKDNNNKNKYNENHSTNDSNKDNIMPPKLTPAALPPKNALKKEPRVEKITSSISKKLKITTPPFKPYSMMTLDGYMVKPYT